MWRRPSNRSLHLDLELIEGVGGPDGDELGGRAVEPRSEVSNRGDREMLEARVALCFRGQFAHIEIVVDVDVQRVALVLDRCDRLTGEVERDRLVTQEHAGIRVDDRSALVADDRVDDPGLLRVRARRAEHPAGRDQHPEARRLRCADRLLRPLADDRVLCDQCAVEVADDDVDVERKIAWKLDQPEVDWTTYAAMSAICCSDS